MTSDFLAQKRQKRPVWVALTGSLCALRLSRASPVEGFLRAESAVRPLRVSSPEGRGGDNDPASSVKCDHVVVYASFLEIEAGEYTDVLLNASVYRRGSYSEPAASRTPCASHDLAVDERSEFAPTASDARRTCPRGLGNPLPRRGSGLSRLRPYRCAARMPRRGA
jgi:hypothetical protein